MCVRRALCVRVCVHLRRSRTHLCTAAAAFSSAARSIRARFAGEGCEVAPCAGGRGATRGVDTAAPASVTSVVVVVCCSSRSAMAVAAGGTSPKTPSAFARASSRASASESSSERRSRLAPQRLRSHVGAMRRACTSLCDANPAPAERSAAAASRSGYGSIPASASVEPASRRSSALRLPVSASARRSSSASLPPPAASIVFSASASSAERASAKRSCSQRLEGAANVAAASIAAASSSTSIACASLPDGPASAFPCASSSPSPSASDGASIASVAGALPSRESGSRGELFSLPLPVRVPFQGVISPVPWLLNRSACGSAPGSGVEVATTAAALLLGAGGVLSPERFFVKSAAR
mmetsp:Transcript_16735/g.54709  ORF Transcript_16735/g.54709 Transcript_16735/m.54709 type:complete len:354 (+) Transcript_16735:259-1320(+)